MKKRGRRIYERAWGGWWLAPPVSALEADASIAIVSHYGTDFLGPAIGAAWCAEYLRAPVEDAEEDQGKEPLSWSHIQDFCENTHGSLLSSWRWDSL